MPEAAKKPVAAKKTEIKAKEKKPIPKVLRDVKYDSTGHYNPKAKHNVDSYEEVLKVLPATYAEMAEAIPQHTDFIGYLIRRGGLEPVS